MQDKPCPHFSIEVMRVPLAGSAQPLRLPIYHCDLKETLVEAIEAGMPPLAFGPDGKLIAWQTCHSQRHQHHCQPALAATAPEPASQPTAEGLGHPSLQEASRIREQSRLLCERASQQMGRAFAAGQQTSALLQSSAALLSRYTRRFQRMQAAA